jgi:hypothetical protein
MFVASCATAPFEKPACPQEVKYSKEFLLKADAAMEALPEGSPLIDLMVDYDSLRRGARACRGEKPDGKAI